jgi:molecular chaperone GrpE
MKKNKPEPETPENDVPANENPQAEQPSQTSAKTEPTLEEKLMAAELEIQALKNKYVMVFADMDNLRKSQDKTFMEAMRYRAEGFIDKLVPALDAFHIALKSPVDDPKLKNYLIGFDYIYKQIQQALESEGVREIPIKINDLFDVNTMHALEAEVSDSPPNRVLRILSGGYKLHDRIVKQALVIVSKVAETIPKPAKNPSQTDAALTHDQNGEKAA